MARLDVFSPRKTEQMQVHIGKVVLFCEGVTEKNYFDYFATIINNNQNKYSHIEIRPLLSGGNAKTVFNYAEDYLSDDSNARELYLYDKYLVFDCDDPDNIEQVILEMLKSSNNYKLLLSNLLFETWLLMHFEDIDKPLRKVETYKKIAKELHLDKYESSEKAMPGIIPKIVGNGDNIRKAINNAKELSSIYYAKGFNVEKDIENMNPYTSIHEFMEKLLIEMHKANI